MPLCYDNEGKQLYDQEKNRKELSRWIDETGGRCLAFDFGTKGILQVRCDAALHCRSQGPQYALLSMLGIAKSTQLASKQAIIMDKLRTVDRGRLQHKSCASSCLQSLGFNC